MAPKLDLEKSSGDFAAVSLENTGSHGARLHVSG
eukprot:CAMPEP_0172723900 /NCGR_PEP_ID=MMETSP1074-20121228/84778_1 /TAXON_ID=2916 /ORGANISM="Ceratium fusus, Strain PA161109" /LENGTH=33 /DNA_ID= /DNA_START= /DNA_END= /DNA_ORIENTATION=